MPLSPARRQLLLPLIVLAVSVVMLASAIWVTLQSRGPGDPPPSAIGGTFSLLDHNGRAVTQDDFKGQPALVFFGFTHCPDVCPTTLFEISELMRKLGPDRKLRGLFVTVDPERDVPELMKSYVSSFDKRITGLTGDRTSIDSMLKAWRVYSKKIPGEGAAYSMDHSAIIYLMDKQMRFVNALPMQDQARAIKEIERWL